MPKGKLIDIIQYLGVFAVASFRIIPGASRILSSFQNIKYIEPSVKLLLQEFDSKDNFLYEKKLSAKRLQHTFEISKRD